MAYSTVQTAVNSQEKYKKLNSQNDLSSGNQNYSSAQEALNKAKQDVSNHPYQKVDVRIDNQYFNVVKLATLNVPVLGNSYDGQMIWEMVFKDSSIYDGPLKYKETVQH